MIEIINSQHLITREISIWEKYLVEAKTGRYDDLIEQIKNDGGDWIYIRDEATKEQIIYQIQMRLSEMVY